MKVSFTKKQRLMLCLLCAAFLALVTSLSILIPHEVRKSHTCRVAFYGVPQNIVEPLIAEIESVRKTGITFTVLDETAPLPANAHSAYSLLFTWNGAELRKLSGRAQSIPDRYREFFPRQIIAGAALDSAHKVFAAPVLLDHVELAFYRPYRTQAALELPQSYGELHSYLNAIKQSAEQPLIAAGADDQILLDTVSVFAASFMNAVEYAALYEKILELGTQPAKKMQVPQELGAILDEIKRLQDEKLTHRSWFQATVRDTDNFMEWRQIGALCMRLSLHRQKPHDRIKYYDAVPFPASENSAGEHAVIVPALCAVSFQNKNSEQAIIEQLLGQDAQDRLSLKTGLAPSTLRAPAADRQADDIRYWAASNAGGIAQPLSSALPPAARIQLAALVRNYLRG